jgi:2-oxoisovalerate dehydrogenase E2 component (dihydrolipoyl transacylase)
MESPVQMPQISESMAEATIGLWLKRPGDRVERFEPLVQIETEKVITEVPSPCTGVVRELLVAEGKTVPVGAPIATIEVEAAAAEAEPAPAAPAPAAGEGEPADGARLFPSSPVPEAPQLPGPTPAPAAAAGGPAPGAGEPPTALGAGVPAPAPYSPAVRRLAAEYGIHPAEVRGTGPGGRVTREDVMAHVARRGTAPAGPGAADAEPVPPSPLRRAIAQRMLASVREIPHAWMMVEADVTGLVRLRQSARADFRTREGFELTYLPFFIKAVVEGLRAQPALNSSWGQAGIVQHRRLDLSIAVAAEEGLAVPVLRAADGLSVAGLARAVHLLAERARAGDLDPEETQGGTFTVNNTGALGSIASMPIIQPDQAGIITLEAIRAEPRVVGEGIAIRHCVHLCLSFDHRVADGLTAGRFMAEVKRVLEAFAPGDAIH